MVFYKVLSPFLVYRLKSSTHRQCLCFSTLHSSLLQKTTKQHLYFMPSWRQIKLETQFSYRGEKNCVASRWTFKLCNIKHSLCPKIALQLATCTAYAQNTYQHFNKLCSMSASSFSGIQAKHSHSPVPF